MALARPRSCRWRASSPNARMHSIRPAIAACGSRSNARTERSSWSSAGPILRARVRGSGRPKAVAISSVLAPLGRKYEVIEQRWSIRAFTKTPSNATSSKGSWKRLKWRRLVATCNGPGPAFYQGSTRDDGLLCEPQASERKYGRRGASLYCIQDATIAACYVQLAATAQDRASCWVGAFDAVEVAGVLRAATGLRPVAIMPIGYPAEAPDRPPRKALDELVRRGAW